MTRILYMSDLHLEMERWRLPVPGWPDFLARHRGAHPRRGPLLDQVGKVDLILVAGDIHNGFRGVIYADQLARYLKAPVVMVAGNHEFYHHDTETLLPALRAAAAKTAGRVNFLENAAVRFAFASGDLIILGCTLWTDYQLNQNQEAAMQHAARSMNDHRFITTRGALFTAAGALARHEASRRWLHQTLADQRVADQRVADQRVANPRAVRTVIVTHHAPSASMLGARTSGIAPAYASDLLEEFAPYRPALWIHGHTHYRHDTVESNIRVVSAPRGYVAFDNADALNYVPGIIDI